MLPYSAQVREWKEDRKLNTEYYKFKCSVVIFFFTHLKKFAHSSHRNLDVLHRLSYENSKNATCVHKTKCFVFKFQDPEQDVTKNNELMHTEYHKKS